MQRQPIAASVRKKLDTALRVQILLTYNRIIYIQIILGIYFDVVFAANQADG